MELFRKLKNIIVSKLDLCYNEKVYDNIIINEKSGGSKMSEENFESNTPLPNDTGAKKPNDIIQPEQPENNIDQPNYSNQADYNNGQPNYGNQADYNNGQLNHGNQADYNNGQPNYSNQADYNNGQPNYGNQADYNNGQPNYGNQAGYNNGQPNYPNGQVVQPVKKSSENGFGIAALVLGIVSFILFCTCINLPLAIVGIVLGIIQLTKGKNKAPAIIGIVLSAVSIIAFLVFWIMVGSGDSTFQKDFQKGLEKGYEGYQEAPIHDLDESYFS